MNSLRNVRHMGFSQNALVYSSRNFQNTENANLYFRVIVAFNSLETVKIILAYLARRECVNGNPQSQVL